MNKKTTLLILDLCVVANLYGAMKNFTDESDPRWLWLIFTAVQLATAIMCGISWYRVWKTGRDDGTGK